MPEKLGSLDEYGEVSNKQVLGATFELIEEIRLRREIELTRGSIFRLFDGPTFV